MKTKFAIGDRVKIIDGSALVGKGVITKITKGGWELNLPWEDSTPHYHFIDEKTKVLVFAIEDKLEKI